MLNPDFKELLQLFNEHHVEYLLVGGYAMAAHGFPRYTGDIDLWVLSSPENAERIMEALQVFGFGGLDLEKSDFHTSQQIIQLGFPPSRIDILTDIDGVVFAESRNHSIELEMDGLRIPCISLDDLVRNKKASGRLQDMADLEKIQGKQ